MQREKSFKSPMSMCESNYLLRSIYSDFKCHCAMPAIACKHYMKSPIMKLKLYCQFQVIFHVSLGLKILKFQIQRVWRLAKVKGLLASSYSYSGMAQHQPQWFSNFIKDVGHADNSGRIHWVYPHWLATTSTPLTSKIKFSWVKTHLIIF